MQRVSMNYSDLDLKLIANQLRMDVIEMLAEAKSGHPAGPLGLAEIFDKNKKKLLVSNNALNEKEGDKTKSYEFFQEMKIDPKNPEWKERDRLVLSNGHVCPVLYSAMARRGFFQTDLLKTLRKLGSPLQGHPSRVWLKGIENSSGPLGQGLSIACGMALAMRMDKIPSRVYCITSDGEHQEGNTWEAVMLAAKYKLDNLINIIDRNYIQIDGKTEDIMPLDPLDEKYKAFNWHAISIDGHNFNQISNALEEAKKTKGKPTVIIANTVPGKGVKFMEHFYEWHGKPPSKEQAEEALEELRSEKVKLMAQLDT